MEMTMQEFKRITKDMELLGTVEYWESTVKYSPIDYRFVDSLTGLTKEDELKTTLMTFHANSVHMIKRDDDLIDGIRANTFCFEFGDDEIHADVIDEDIFPYEVALLTANHKGLRMTNVYIEKK